MWQAISAPTTSAPVSWVAKAHVPQGPSDAGAIRLVGLDDTCAAALTRPLRAFGGQLPAYDNGF
jgi:hypothetical protein